MMGALAVQGSAQLQDVAVGGSLAVQGASQVQNLTVQGDLAVGGAIVANGGALLAGTVNSNGTLNLNGTTNYKPFPTATSFPLNNFLVTPGTIISFGGETVPDGYLECNAQEVSRTDFAALFAAIGTAWGAGDGETTFNVPDLRGMFLRGTGTNGTLNASGGAKAAGPSVGVSAVDTFAAHKHYLLRNDGTKLADTFVNAFDTLGTGIGTSLGGLTSGGYEYGGKPWTETVGSTVETKPVNAGVLFCVKF